MYDMPRARAAPASVPASPIASSRSALPGPRAISRPGITRKRGRIAFRGAFFPAMTPILLRRYADPVKTVKVICPHDCPDTCVMTVGVENGRAVTLGGDPDHRFTAGFLCAKVN